MARDSEQECYRTLQLSSADYDHFKAKAIEGAENHQTYPVDLLELKKDDIETYAIDFFLDGTNLMRWWSRWSEAQRTSWLSTARGHVEQALVTLFEHWIEQRRTTGRRSYLSVLKTDQTPSRKTRAPVKRSPGGDRHNHANETIHKHGFDQGVLDTNRTKTPMKGSSTMNNNTEIAPQTPITPQTTNGSLSDIENSVNGDEAMLDDSDGIPSLAEILRSPSTVRRRQESKTIEPQSPPRNPTVKHPAREEDSTYIDSQPSTIGLPPISPPFTRHKRKYLNEIIDDGMDDDPIMSPLMKRGRGHRTIQSNTSTASSESIISDDEELSQASHILVNIPARASTQIEGRHAVPNDQQEVKDNPQQQSDGQDAFEELSHVLQDYLQECGKSNLRRANDPQISKREAEKLHIRSGILKHLYSDVVSRIEAVRARREGLDKSDEISWCTYYS